VEAQVPNDAVVLDEFDFECLQPVKRFVGTGQWAAPLFVEDDFGIVSVEQGKARPVGEAAIEFDASEVGWMLLDGQSPGLRD